MTDKCPFCGKKLKEDEIHENCTDKKTKVVKNIIAALYHGSSLLPGCLSVMIIPLMLLLFIIFT